MFDWRWYDVCTAHELTQNRPKTTDTHNTPAQHVYVMLSQNDKRMRRAKGDRERATGPKRRQNETDVDVDEQMLVWISVWYRRRWHWKHVWYVHV